MSHFSERKEKNCLNCNARVAGRYCQVCGQENIPAKETFWHLVMHFFNDITHFDGKFFTTTKLLLIKPGFLPREYLRGKRSSYLHPIRMYVFTSAVFFLIFFMITSGGELAPVGDAARRIANEKKIDDIDSLKMVIKDSAALVALTGQQEKYKAENEFIDSTSQASKEKKTREKSSDPTNKSNKADTMVEKKPTLYNIKDSIEANSSGVNIRYGYPDSVRSTESYEHYQASLPEAQRDGWLTRIVAEKQIGLNNKYRYNRGEVVEVFKEKFLHSLPQMLFVSLPLFALVLHALYARRKEFFYTDHGVFSIYHFIAVFIIMLVLLLLQNLQNATGWIFFKYLSIGCVIYILFYLYKSMHNFYGQGRAKTVLKFILLCLIAGTLTSFITLGFLLLTFFKV